MTQGLQEQDKAGTAHDKGGPPLEEQDRAKETPNARTRSDPPGRGDGAREPATTAPRKNTTAMPQTVDAPTQDDQQAHDATAQPIARPQVNSVAFPEAPQDAPAACNNQLDVLLDMDVPVTVVLGSTQVPVRRLLQLGPGAVLRLEKPIEAPADLFLKDAKFAEADVVVVDNQFAVRIKEIVTVAAPAAAGQK
jgi:flagellar motor switch protein FliN/FliY